MTDFEKIYSFESLYNAYRKARQGKRWKGAAAKFEVNLLEALNLLSAQIRTKRYTMSPYNTFEVYEPKRRVVMSNSYKDKVVQHSLCDNVLEPILTRSFIRDNYASQVGKGTHYGLDRLQEFMRRFYRKNGIDGWILKGDISKYFYSIRHDVLKTLIREKITDPDVLWLMSNSYKVSSRAPVWGASSGRFVACRSYHRQHRRQRRNTDRQSDFTAFRPSLP